MNEREKRDFQAGLAAEVDALPEGRADPPRLHQAVRADDRHAGRLRPAARQHDGLGAGPGRRSSSPIRARRSASAQALALEASTEGPADGSAYRAVEAAKQYAGVTINMTYEAGLQALDPRNFSGPMWEQLTGIKSNVVELSNPDQYSKAVAEHIAGSGAYDVLDISPAWTPSLADGGVIAPLDDYIAKYMNMADLEDYHPLYKALPTYKGKIWGFFDDGDMFALYYRKDIFEDPAMMEAYQAKFGTPLAPPKTWEEYAQIAQFITDQKAPDVYGAGHFRKAGSPGNQFDFLQQFRANGGQLFDDEHEGAARLAGRRQDAAEHARRQRRLDPRQQRARRGLALGRVPDRQGGDDLFVAAHGAHGGELLAERHGDQLRPALADRRQGRLRGGSGQPGARDRLQQGAVGGLGRTPTPPTCSCSGRPRRRCRSPACMLPYALRDPYRLSHFKSDLYAQLWPDAKEYLLNLNNSANVGLLDPIMPGAQDYFLSIDRMATAVWAGADPQEALETAAAEWDDTTERLGVDSQKAFYAEFLKLPGATADNTVEKLGMAVKLGGR